MRFKLLLILSGALCGAVSRPAIAAPIPESEMYEVLPQNSADHKAEKANPTTMPWCEGKFAADPWPVEKFKAAIRAYHDFAAWAEAAEHFCEHKEDPTWVRQATYLVQAWMNANQNSQAEAEREIRDQLASAKQKKSPVRRGQH